VLLAVGIFGTPVQATFAVRALIVFGMVTGATGVGALFAVGGAVAGAAVGVRVLAETPARKAAATDRGPRERPAGLEADRAGPREWACTRKPVGQRRSRG
jgi:hypothetical protein